MIELDVKTLDNVMRDKPQGTNANQWLAAELNRINGIVQLLAFHKSKIKKVEDDARERIKKIEHDMQTIRDGCKHESQTYHPDPSGGRDSTTICNICGKELA